MLRRRALLENLGGGVPEWRKHLQPCEYLQNSGTQYITMDFSLNDITYIKIKCQQLTPHTNSGFFGGGYDANHVLRIFCPASDLVYECTMYGKTSQNIISTIAAGEICTIELDKSDKTATFNNEIKTATNTFTTVNQNIYLFGNFIKNFQLYINSNCIIYNCETNLFNLLSCYVIDKYTDNKGVICSSGVAGMVDTLTGIFYTNDGSGSFSHGGDINI